MKLLKKLVTQINVVVGGLHHAPVQPPHATGSAGGPWLGTRGPESAALAQAVWLKNQPFRAHFLAPGRATKVLLHPWPWLVPPHGPWQAPHAFGATCWAWGAAGGPESAALAQVVWLKNQLFRAHFLASGRATKVLLHPLPRLVPPHGILHPPHAFGATC